MFAKISKPAQSTESEILSEEQMSGFILLEVLIAMSLVLSVWIGSVSIYHSLILQLGKEQEKRMQIHQELDQHEIEQSQKGIHDSARMPHRNRPITDSNSPVDKK